MQSADFWNGIIREHAEAQAMVAIPAAPLKPSDLTRDQWTYKGWQISFDMPPVPSRAFDWTATSPDYDMDCDQDGFFRCAGDQVHAATYEELLEEIDLAILDAEDEA